MHTPSACTLENEDNLSGADKIMDDNQDAKCSMVANFQQKE